MKKLDKIKDYFIKNNITIITGGYCNFTIDDGRFSLNFNTDLYDINSIRKEFIICLKKKNTSYLIDFLSEKPRYQKIGNYDKGHDLAFELILYFSSYKYINCPNIFIDSQKQTYQKDYNINIKKYENYWLKKLEEYPEQFSEIIERFEHNKKLQRKLKLEKLNG